MSQFSFGKKGIDKGNHFGSLHTFGGLNFPPSSNYCKKNLVNANGEEFELLLTKPNPPNLLRGSEAV